MYRGKLRAIHVTTPIIMQDMIASPHQKEKDDLERRDVDQCMGVMRSQDELDQEHEGHHNRFHRSLSFE